VSVTAERGAGETADAARSLAPRSDFPLLRDVTYLNPASIGLIPLPVQYDAQTFEREVASRGTTWFDEVQETGVLERARVAAGRLLNADPDCIAIPSSASEALGQVAWSLRPGAGSNVVSVDIEFPSVTYPWFRLAEETGVEVRLVEVFDDPASLSIDLIAGLVDERTEIICVSHVQYATGARIDIERLAQLAHAHGALLIVDATQSAGIVPIDVRASNVDVLVAGGYKWLGGPFGAAVLYLSPPMLERFHPLLVGWRSTHDPYSLDARTMPLAESARRAEFSTMSYTAGQTLGAAIEYVLDLGIDRILEHDLALADRLIAGLDELGAEILTPRARDARAGTVTARFPGRDGEAVAADLCAAGVTVSPRFGSTRFSAHVFNAPVDVDNALSTLEQVLSTRGETR
jgi:cysteine desulfurase/selenocysteine lyase